MCGNNLLATNDLELDSERVCSVKVQVVPSSRRMRIDGLELATGRSNRSERQRFKINHSLMIERKFLHKSLSRGGGNGANIQLTLDVRVGGTEIEAVERMLLLTAS